MRELSRLTLAFAASFLLFLLAPAFLAGEFVAYPLMRTGSLFDLLTPLVLIPLYWLLFRLGPRRAPATGDNLRFLVVAALWGLGHGMHLAANALGHQLPALPTSGLHTLTTFLDERLSHYLWHAAVVALSVLIMDRQLRAPFAGERSGLLPETVGALLYGFTFFAIVTEGQTAPLGVTSAVALVGWGAMSARNRLGEVPLVYFFTAGHAVALLFFGVWFLKWGGLPEFSHVGLIAP